MKKVLILFSVVSLLFVSGFIIYPHVLNALYSEKKTDSRNIAIDEADILYKNENIEEGFIDSSQNNIQEQPLKKTDNTVSYITITNDVSTITVARDENILVDMDKEKLYEDVVEDNTIVEAELGLDFYTSGLSYITIVIDDSGNTLKRHEEYIKLAKEYDITFAIMPDAPKATDFDKLCYDGSVNTIIHMPMQNKGAKYFGEKTIIKTYMSNYEISNMLDYAFNIVPHATGINNHTGSFATSDENTMRNVVGYLKNKDKYFFDSLTSGTSVAYSISREYNVPTAKRDVFLDNEDDYDAVLKQWNILLRIAEKEGNAIAIGHYWSDNTFYVLSNELPNIAKKNIVTKSIKEVVR